MNLIRGSILKYRSQTTSNLDTILTLIRPIEEHLRLLEKIAEEVQATQHEDEQVIAITKLLL